MSIPPFIRKAVASVFLASMAFSLTPVVAQAAETTKDVSSPSSPDLLQGEQRYIVKYKNDANSEAESESLKRKGFEVKDTFTHSLKASVVVATPNEIRSLEATEEVAAVELDQRVSISGATSIWGLDRVDQRTGRNGQYDIEGEGSGVNVYVVDSGIYTSHTEFTGRIPTSWNGIADGRGVNDCNGHGTHVAGTVAGTTYGVAKKANIIPIRVLECDGTGWSSTVIKGLDWAIAHHQAGQPAVMNMSIGGFTSASLDQSVRNVINDGITVVAAAGNDNVDACSSAPASVTPAITVAATDINDTQASFSNYGSCVDIQAPGVSIRSAYNNAPTGYNTMSGTSMAAPHVSGAAAIMLSRNRSMTPAQVHQSIINDATVGVVNGNKGSTPNRFLFIPAFTPTPVDCSNLKLGDAWTGVGLTCKLNGQAASATGTSESVPMTASSHEGSESAGSALHSPAPVAEEADPTSVSPEAVKPESKPAISESVVTSATSTPTTETVHGPERVSVIHPDNSNSMEGTEVQVIPSTSSVSKRATIEALEGATPLDISTVANVEESEIYFYPKTVIVFVLLVILFATAFWILRGRAKRQ